jgi:hypothetical protein
MSKHSPRLIYCEVPSQLFLYRTSLSPPWIPKAILLVGKIICFPFSAMASRRIDKTRWVLFFVYTFWKLWINIYHLIDVSTLILEISSTRDDIDGISPLPMTLRSMATIPGSTKQGEFSISCMHFANTKHVLTTWSMYQHGFWKYRPRGTISTGFRHRRWRCDRRWCYQNRQNEVSFVFCVYILQAVRRPFPNDSTIHEFQK